MEHNEAISSVLQTLFTLNRLWINGNTNELTVYFHKRMIGVIPNRAGHINGKTACMEARQALLNHIDVLTWAEIAPTVELFNDTAVVSYRFSMTYTDSVADTDADTSEPAHSGRTYTLDGYELMTFVRDGDKWCVITDHISLLPTK